MTTHPKAPRVLMERWYGVVGLIGDHFHKRAHAAALLVTEDMDKLVLECVSAALMSATCGTLLDREQLLRRKDVKKWVKEYAKAAREAARE